MELEPFVRLISVMLMIYLGFIGLGGIEKYYEYLSQYYEKKWNVEDNVFIFNNPPKELLIARSFFNRVERTHLNRIKEIFVKSGIYCIVLLIYIGIRQSYPANDYQMVSNLTTLYIFHILWRTVYLIVKVKEEKVLNDDNAYINPHYPFKTCDDPTEKDCEVKHLFYKVLRILKCFVLPRFIPKNISFDLYIRAAFFFIVSIIFIHADFGFYIINIEELDTFNNLVAVTTLVCVLAPYILVFLLDVQMVLRIHWHCDKANKIIKKQNEKETQDLLQMAKIKNN